MLMMGLVLQIFTLVFCLSLNHILSLANSLLSLIILLEMQNLKLRLNCFALSVVNGNGKEEDA